MTRSQGLRLALALMLLVLAINNSIIAVPAGAEEWVQAALFASEQSEASVAKGIRLGLTPPWRIFEVAKLTVPDARWRDSLGYSVSMSGDTLVSGAYSADLDSSYDQGAVYIFNRHLGGMNHWGQLKKLVAADGAKGDMFGRSVSLSNGDLAVGAIGADVGGRADQGAAYVFYRDQGGADSWGQVKKVTAIDGDAGDSFGFSVSLSGDTLVVGAPTADVAGNKEQGAVYVFHRNQHGPNAWGQVMKVVAQDGDSYDRLGFSISLEGDMLAVGSVWADVNATPDAGAVYLFYRDQGGPNNWGQVAKLAASDLTGSSSFGHSVSLVANTLVVGSSTAGVAGNVGQGATYIFYRNHGGTDNWGQITELTAPDGAANDHFGYSVSVSGDKLVVGAVNADVLGRADQGAVYVFYRHLGGTDNWGLAAKLTASDGAAMDWFGNCVSLSEDQMVVGADGAGAERAGAAYVFQWRYGTYLPVVSRQ